jgi:Ni/Co efflux regulator RcnB
MKIALSAIGLVLAAGSFAPAQARTYQPQNIYGAYCGAPPSPEINRAYDWALSHYRTRGVWLDGGDHAGWKRGQRVPANVAAAATIDWCEAHLFTPGVNNRWVRVGDDYLEISRYTGRINTVALAYARQGYLGDQRMAEAAKPAKRVYVKTIPQPKPKINYEK